MTWYAAHAILYFRLKSGQQDTYPIWENVYLVSAESPENALAAAKALAMEASGDSGGTLTLYDQPAELIYAGIRKLITVAHYGITEELASGDEITYSEYVVDNLESVMKLAEGESVKTEYVE